MVTAAPAERDTAGGQGGEASRRVRDLPASAVRRATYSASTTPGRLSIVAVALVVLSLLTGLVGALAVAQKQDTLDDLVNHREPLAAAAQQIFRSLSDADATAASAFLSGGVEPAEQRARYELDIAQAGAALAKAGADVGGIGQAQGQIEQIAQQLPVYTGLVETARTNNRQGFPAGAAYLREASGLMRSKILPAAQELYRIDYERLNAEQDDATSFPWGAAVLALALLVALAVTQRWLTARTNRLLNVGLLVATGAVVVALIWSTVALLIVTAKVHTGRRNGSEQVNLLVQARIAASQCRADETLTLVARGSGGDYETEWKKVSPTISGGGGDNLLRQAMGLASSTEVAEQVQHASDAADSWLKAHQQIRTLDDGGKYAEAVEVAIGTGKDSAATAFADLDKNLIGALNQGRQEFFEQTGRAGNALTALVGGLALLALLAAVGVTMGIRQRLREYR